MRSEPSDVRRVRKATTDDVVEVARTLSEALGNDPVLRWLFPKDSRRAKATPEFFEWTIRTQSLPLDEVWCTDDLGAAALWAPLDRWRVPFTSQLKLLPRAMSLFRTRTPRLLIGFNKLEIRHPAEPHWHLYFIGTRPSMQNKGRGSALLAPILEQADQQGVHVYLEASTPRVVPFYARHGFEATQEFSIKGGPTWTLMLRSPRTS